MRYLALVFLPITFLFSNVCDDIKRDSTSFFMDEYNFNKIEKNLKCVAIMNDLDRLKDISIKIRGVNIDCDGDYAITYQKKFQFKILKALLAPELYKKDLLDSNSFDQKNNENRTNLKNWSLKSLHNFKDYSQFNSLYQIAVPMLVDYYQKELGYDKGSSIFFANRLASEYLEVAAGKHKNEFSINRLDQNIMNSSFDNNELIDYLFTNSPSSSELDSALKTSILQKRNLNFIETLLEWGANINSGYESALFFALDDIDMAVYLINKGADVNYKNTFGITPLFDAVEYKNEDLVNLLIKYGANVNARIISSYEKMGIISTRGDYAPFGMCGLNHTSKTLLMHAAHHSNLNIVKRLIVEGANLNEVDDLGFNVVDFANMNEDKEILKYLHSLELKENIIFGGYDE